MVVVLIMFSIGRKIRGIHIIIVLQAVLSIGQYGGRSYEENGYSVKVGLMWKYFPRDTVILQRGSFQNGYQCYVYCMIQKDGNEVRIDSIDGEADYYPLSTAWMISYIFRKFFKLNVELYSDTDDVDVDLNGFLSQLQDIR